MRAAAGDTASGNRPAAASAQLPHRRPVRLHPQPPACAGRPHRRVVRRQGNRRPRPAARAVRRRRIAGGQQPRQRPGQTTERPERARIASRAPGGRPAHTLPGSRRRAAAVCERAAGADAGQGRAHCAAQRQDCAAAGQRGAGGIANADAGARAPGREGAAVAEPAGQGVSEPAVGAGGEHLRRTIGGAGSCLDWAGRDRRGGLVDGSPERRGSCGRCQAAFIGLFHMYVQPGLQQQQRLYSHVLISWNPTRRRRRRAQQPAALMVDGRRAAGAGPSSSPARVSLAGGRRPSARARQPSLGPRWRTVRGRSCFFACAGPSWLFNPCIEQSNQPPTIRSPPAATSPRSAGNHVGPLCPTRPRRRPSQVPRR